MDESKASNLTFGGLWRVGVVASFVWVMGAAFTGRSALALFGLPAILGLWIYAFITLDRWVSGQQRTSMTAWPRSRPYEAPRHE
jgi:hypothetical protein